MRTHRKLILAVVSMAGMVAVAGIVLAQGRVERQDCPGKITCPQTGEIICRDQCPTVDPNRPDCPGRIVCPSTGKLICKDRCPLDQSGTTAEPQPPKLPPCCAKSG
ncbi:MAG: hypothetical protein IID40_09890 [Planctomycetes bacterium]|nr:hypothetical protein [Planctomycetota bacterium]